MGRLFLIEYDQTPDTKFYLCRTCHTHIALAGNLLYSTMLPNEGHFKKAVNLLIDGPEHYRRVGVITEADATCNKCLGHLGWKYVEDATNSLIGLRKEERLIVLRMDKLLLWNGEQVVDAN